jgi:hypothetical protein
VTFIRRAANRVADENDPKAGVNGIEDGRQHADIGFRAADDEAVGLAAGAIVAVIVAAFCALGFLALYAVR